eukprot:gene5705-12173_t
MDRWHRFLFRKATGASVSCTPNVTRTQITALLCLISAKLLSQDQQGSISEFLGHCLGKFSPPAVQRAEQEAPPPLKAGNPDPLRGDDGGPGGGTGADARRAGDGSNRRSRSPSARPPPAAAPAAGAPHRSATPPRARSADELRNDCERTTQANIASLTGMNAQMQTVITHLARTMREMQTGMRDMQTSFTSRLDALERRPPAPPPAAAAPALGAPRDAPRAAPCAGASGGGPLDWAAFDDAPEISRTQDPPRARVDPHAHPFPGGSGGGGRGVGSSMVGTAEQGRPRLHEVLGHPSQWRDYVDPGQMRDDE